MDYAPKKRLRGKQEVAPQDPQPMEIIAGSKTSPQKPKVAKAKARPATKGGPRAPQFTEKMQAHFKQNAGAIGLAERVKKRQGKAPGIPPPPIDARDVFAKMPEVVRKVPEFQRKFKEEIPPGAHDWRYRSRKLCETYCRA